MAGSGPRELRRGVLAVQVLDDVDVTPADDGVVLPGEPLLHVPWSECRSALLDRSPDGPEGRLRLASWLRARRWAADAGAGLPQRVRPVGLPADHALHPGPDWVRQRVLGGALDLGLGAVGLDPADPDGVCCCRPRRCATPASTPRRPGRPRGRCWSAGARSPRSCWPATGSAG